LLTWLGAMPSAQSILPTEAFDAGVVDQS